MLIFAWWLPYGNFLLPSFFLHFLVSFLQKGRVFPSAIYIHWFIFISMNSWILIYLMVKSITINIFDSQIVPGLARGILLQLVPVLSDKLHLSHLLQSNDFLSTSFLTKKIFQVRCTLRVPALTLDISPRNPPFFLVENRFRYQNLNTWFQDCF